ncbi:hypothetical protein PssvBMR4_gp46 [Pseudomonas phage MR4]|uniref:Uncharacterized protein n=1 Tax=Pseudomonas phage MR4 TaxID=2711171 RepID=A0A6M3T997_9CAUD|nr:hypothetical protein PssvBMR4_gp46 [Pseudomonas phage MR4]
MLSNKIPELTHSRNTLIKGNKSLSFHNFGIRHYNRRKLK